MTDIVFCAPSHLVLGCVEQEDSMAYTYLQELHDPDELEVLPATSVINDNGLRAEKSQSGAWRYPTGEYWEPAWFPCLLVWVPEFGGEPPAVLTEDTDTL
jgi:hypothetical protein